MEDGKTDTSKGIRHLFWACVGLFIIGLVVCTMSAPSRHKPESVHRQVSTNHSFIRNPKTHVVAGQQSHPKLLVELSTASSEHQAGNLLEFSYKKKSGAPSLKARIPESDRQTTSFADVEIINHSKPDRHDLLGYCKSENIKAYPMNVSFVMYNRVPKCGSTTSLGLIKKLAVPNDFYILPEGSGLTPGYRYTQEELFYYLKDLARYPTPIFHSKHLHYADFDRHESFRDREKPAYINVVRDPIERLASWYYFIRFTHKRPMLLSSRLQKYDSCVLYGIPECVTNDNIFHLIPFFCGHDDFCKEPSVKSLLQAKDNIRSNYALVGTLERLPEFYGALEKLMPQYFNGIRRLYDSEEAHGHGKKLKTMGHRPVGRMAREKMQKKLALEYDLYYFIVKRFNDQLDCLDRL